MCIKLNTILMIHKKIILDIQKNINNVKQYYSNGTQCHEILSLIINLTEHWRELA